MDALVAAVVADTAARGVRTVARGVALAHLASRARGAVVPDGPPANGCAPPRLPPSLAVAGLVERVRGETAELQAARHLDPLLRMRLAALTAASSRR